jgi:hypothetical protein
MSVSRNEFASAYLGFKLLSFSQCRLHRYELSENGQEIMKQMQSPDGIARNSAHIPVTVAPFGGTGNNIGASIVCCVLLHTCCVKLRIFVFQLWQCLGTGMRAHANHTAQQYLLPIVLVCSFCLALGGGQIFRTVRVAFLLTKVRLYKTITK